MQVCDDRDINTKIRTYDDKVYAYFRGLNVSEDGVECGSFTIILTGSSLVYDKKIIMITSVFIQICL